MDSDTLEKQEPDKLRLQNRFFSLILSKKVPKLPSEDERKIYPERKANVISRMMFWWLNPILKVGYKRTLQPEDLFKLSEEIKVDFLYSKFKKHFDLRVLKRQDQFVLSKCKARNETLETSTFSRETDLEDFEICKMDLCYGLYKTVGFDFFSGIFFKVLSDVASTMDPLLQKKLTDFVESRALGLESGVGQGVGYAVGCSAMLFFISVTINLSFYHLMISGAKSRCILTRLMLEKSMKLDAKGEHSFPSGQINSIMSTDLNRIDFGIGLFPFIFCFPIPVAISIGLLISNIGVASLVGIFTFVVMLGLLAMCFKKLVGLRKNATKFTDIRVNLTKELLKNFKMIKFYCWESSYSTRLEAARTKEMKYVFTLQAFRNVIVSFVLALPNLAAMASFLTMYRISSARSSGDIFSSLSLFNVLSNQFILLPMSLATGADLKVGFERVAKFLSCGEVSYEESYIETFTDEKLAVKVVDGGFEWEQFEDTKEEEEEREELENNLKKNKKNNKNKNTDRSAEEKEKTEKVLVEPELKLIESESSSVSKTDLSLKPTEFPGLHNLNFEIYKGEFIVITGSIGSGKSSLLNALSGFMKKTNGHVYVDGDLLLCGYSWVRNATIRENILFGLPYDQKKYDDVIYACCLQNDFKMFNGGDMTEVGERGITLSGGQKARINLARAVYADKDIILLDDVLSAVDAKVGKHIVHRCILGLLKNKTRVLATHQLNLVNDADRMIFLNGDGTIDTGTIKELESRNENVVKLFKYQQQETENSAELDIIGDDDDHGDDDDDDDNEKREIANNPHVNEVRIVADEEKAVNSITWNVYKHYLVLGFGVFKFSFIPLFITSAILGTFCEFFSNNWLSFWISNKFPGRSEGFYMGLYIMFNFLYAILLAIEFALMVYLSSKSSENLNIMATQNILHVPMAFMDVSPMGRVLNRFTKDTDVLDNEIIEQLRMAIFPMCLVIGTFILCIIYLPWFAIAVPIVAFLYFGITSYYQASSREIKRIDAVKRSLVYSHFNETIGGKNTIKAYKQVPNFLGDLNDFIDQQNEAFYLTLVSQRWLGSNIAIITVGFVFIVAMLCCFRVFKISASSTGLLLSYSMGVPGLLSLALRAITQVENEFNSVERMNHYAFDLVQEAPYEIPETDPSPDWPQKGSIKFENVSMKYRAELPYVLKNVSMNIESNEKVGFCGRTGAGKSTFMTCLYRLTEFEGKIHVDDVDISKLGLHALRSKLTIIPQDPVLFVGNIRHNLDPFNETTDDKLWTALVTAGLIDAKDLASVKLQQKDDENLHKFHLERVVEDDGTNFSLGERQLIALARALVKNTKILILDEATSSVDYETDSKIQNTIATEFKNCTILCIAHRLKTILGYDRIVVMDKGEVVSFDKPLTLYNQKDGIFRSMCDQSGITEKDFECN